MAVSVEKMHMLPEAALDDVFVALHRSARRAPGGISGIARRLGKREKTLLNKLDPSDDTHQPTLGEFVAILSVTGDLQPLHELAALFGVSLSTRSKDRGPSVAQAVMRSMAEHGDVVRAVEMALRDGVISDDERAAILREIFELRHAMTVLENTLKEHADG